MKTTTPPRSVILLIPVLILAGCSDEDAPATPDPGPDTRTAVERTFEGAIDLENLADYEGLTPPRYIRKNNAGINAVSDAGATLGRVLFYDTALSVDRTVSCASCHDQDLAFSDGDRYAFVSNRDAGTVSVIDVGALAKVGDLETGPVPI